ncbi:MAG: hypothetical protein RL677_343 [Actinomycetota bacterium]|jgi:hypothetical protein
MERSLIEIRPLSITEIISASLRSLYRNPGGTLLISLNFAVILGLISLFGFYLAPIEDSFLDDLAALDSPAAADPLLLQNLLNQALPTITFLASLTFLLYLFQGVVTGIIAPVIGFLVTGSKLTRNEAWLRVKNQIGRLLALSFIILILEIFTFFAPLFLAAVVSSVFPPVVNGFLISLSLVVAIVLVIFVWTSLLLAPVVLILENTTIKLSLLRSRKLVKKNFARILFGTIWASIIGQALALFGQLPFSIISQSSQSGNQITTFSTFTETVGTIVGYSLLLSFIASYLCLLYTDQRIRHEDLANNLKLARGQ